MIMGKSKHDLREPRAKSMRSQARNGNGWLFRLVAGLMLAVMLPASVFAAPLRYCVGQNGHRGLEFVHAKECSHADAEAKSCARLIDVEFGALVLGSHCQDRVLLPEAAKPEACSITGPGAEPSGAAPERLQVQSNPRKWTKWSPRQSVAHVRHLDPRLVSLKTVVLLN